MVAFGHTAVGTLVGLSVYHYFGTTQPELGLLVAGGAGIVSHYITDFIPHGHFIKHKDFKRLIIWDIIFNLGLSVIFFAGMAFFQAELGWKFWFILFGIGGAQLPDILDGFYYLEVLPHSGFFKFENSFHRSMHWHGIFKKGILIDGQPMKKSDVWQIAMVVIAFLALTSY